MVRSTDDGQRDVLNGGGMAGTPSPYVNRRLAAILVADVVGYSRLMAQ